MSITEEKQQFKVGDQILCEMELGTVHRIEEDRITEFYNGFGIQGGHSLECFRPTPVTIEFSKSAHDLATSLHCVNIRGLNYPDINRLFIEEWAMYMKMYIQQQDPIVLKIGLEKITLVHSEFISAVKEVEKIKVRGVHLFR